MTIVLLQILFCRITVRFQVCVFSLLPLCHVLLQDQSVFSLNVSLNLIDYFGGIYNKQKQQKQQTKQQYPHTAHPPKQKEKKKKKEEEE